MYCFINTCSLWKPTLPTCLELTIFIGVAKPTFTEPPDLAARLNRVENLVVMSNLQGMFRITCLLHY